MLEDKDIVDDDDIYEDYFSNYTEEETYEEECRRRYQTALDYANIKYDCILCDCTDSDLIHPMGLCAVLYITNNLNITNILVSMLHNIIDYNGIRDEEAISKIGLKEVELEAINLIRKDDCSTLEDYIKSLSINKTARIVKVCERICYLENILKSKVSDNILINCITETREYFIELAKDTGISELLEETLLKLENSVKFVKI